jgi:hypothetical protein
VTYELGTLTKRQNSNLEAPCHVWFNGPLAEKAIIIYYTSPGCYVQGLCNMLHLVIDTRRSHDSTWYELDQLRHDHTLGKPGGRLRCCEPDYSFSIEIHACVPFFVRVFTIPTQMIAIQIYRFPYQTCPCVDGGYQSVHASPWYRRPKLSPWRLFVTRMLHESQLQYRPNNHVSGVCAR